jgi:hypothetical protein
MDRAVLKREAPRWLADEGRPKNPEKSKLSGYIINFDIFKIE